PRLAGERSIVQILNDFQPFKILLCFQYIAEIHKTLYLVVRFCASLVCDMFDDKKLAQEDKKSPCANALSQVTNTI
ncbi:hypothetical protein ACXHFU_004707, partial [Escherichia coli]